MQQLESPAQFLGYEPGDHFTPHHRILSYAEHVAENSDRATLHHYGTTYERRELIYLLLTSPDNHENIDEIRLNNLKISGFEAGEPTGRQKAVIWLSYNVHGNEPSSSEAAMLTLYELAVQTNTETGEWLENSVVILDPVLNPDGRERYVHWYNQVEGADFNPHPDAREHHEPWPEGRSNHYYFDLNRDWAWQTQHETRQRVDIYQEWMPHIHVDFHEQYHTDPYYFAPAAEPFHRAITDWQREFQTAAGLNHATYFNEKGWLYFTREVFDLFYPGYGDTWPLFNGSVGMTYEQAGHSMAGRGILLPEGSVLTLRDRLDRHHVTGMSTVEIVSAESQRVIREFESHFSRAVNEPDGDYGTYVVKGDNQPDKIYSLLQYLDDQMIRYGIAESSYNVDAYHYGTGLRKQTTIESDDIIISSHQPQSQLVRVLFEPRPVLADSLTYDITAWEAHYRFGLEGYALQTFLDPVETVSADDYRGFKEVGNTDSPYAHIVRWESMDDARFLADLLDQGIRVRFSMTPFTLDNTPAMNNPSFEKGTLIITRADNSSNEAFDDIVLRTAREHARHLFGTNSGFVSEGSDFGSANVRLTEAPKIALLTGEGTTAASAGEIWHYFDHQLDYPVTLLDTGHLEETDLDYFDLLILPSGDYHGVLSESTLRELQEWIRTGGRLVAIGDANKELAGKEGFGISLKPEEPESESSAKTEELLKRFGDQTRKALQSSNPGSIYRITLDNSHPLSFGYREDYYSLKLESDPFEYLEEGWNVGITRPDAHVSGFTGHKIKSRLGHSLTFGVEEIGDGAVIYMADNPLFRGFWENGKLLFANAVFLVSP